MERPTPGASPGCQFRWDAPSSAAIGFVPCALLRALRGGRKIRGLVRLGSADLIAREPGGVAQICRNEVRVAEVRAAEVGPAEIRPAEVRLAEVSLAEVGAGEIRPAQVRPTEIGLPEVSPWEIRPAEIRLVEVSSAKLRFGQVRSCQVSLAKRGRTALGQEIIGRSLPGQGATCLCRGWDRPRQGQGEHGEDNDSRRLESCTRGLHLSSL